MTPKVMINDEERDQRMAAARIKLEQAVNDIASCGLFGGPDRISTEIEILEEATELVRQAERHRQLRGHGV